MTDNTPFTTPDNTHTLKDRIFVSYLNSLDSSMELREWMLRPEGYRTGTFKQHYTPFYLSFVRLYELTQVLPHLANETELKKEIEMWMCASEGITKKSTALQGKCIRAGLSLFEKWVIVLHEQLIIEFT